MMSCVSVNLFCFFFNLSVYVCGIKTGGPMSSQLKVAHYYDKILSGSIESLCMRSRRVSNFELDSSLYIAVHCHGKEEGKMDLYSLTVLFPCHRKGRDKTSFSQLLKF